MTDKAGIDAWFIRVQAGERGPFSGRQLKEFAKAGKISTQTLIRRGDRREWLRAGAVRGLFPQAEVAAEADVVGATTGGNVAKSKSATGATSTASRTDFMRQVASGGRVAGPVAGLFGFVADVLSPLAPINGVLFLASLLLFGILGYRCHVQRRLASLDFSRLLPEQAFVFSSFLLPVFGLWFVLQAATGTQDRGVLAANIPAIANFQASILDVKKQVAEVAKTTRAVKEDTTAIRRDTAAMSEDTAAIKAETAGVRDATREIQDTNERIAQDVAEISDKISKVGDGSMIQNPESPSDFYHNAKLQELSGRFKDAFESYRRYVEMNEEFVDPCLDYLALMQSQRGHKAAEAEFNDLARKFPDNRAISLAAASLASGPEKREALEKFSRLHKDFGPTFWLAAREYSNAVMRIQSAVAVEHERAFLEKLVAADESGNFTRYFMDKKLGSEQLQQARARLNEITTKQLGVRMWLGEEHEPWPASSPLGPAGFMPIDFSVPISIFDGHVKAVSFRLGDAAWAEVPADQVRRLNDRLASVVWVPQMIPLPQANEALPARDAEAVVWFKYEDVNGLQSPPVSVFRVRRFAPEGVDPRRALGAKPEAESPARTASP